MKILIYLKFKISLTIESIYRLNHLNWREHLIINIWSNHIWNYNENFKFPYLDLNSCQKLYLDTIKTIPIKEHFLTFFFYMKHIFWI